MNRIWNTHVDTMGKTTLPLEFLRPTALLKSGKIVRLSTRFALFKADLSLAHRDSVFDLGYHIAAQGPLAPRRRPASGPVSPRERPTRASLRGSSPLETVRRVVETLGGEPGPDFSTIDSLVAQGPGPELGRRSRLLPATILPTLFGTQVRYPLETFLWAADPNFEPTRPDVVWSMVYYWRVKVPGITRTISVDRPEQYPSGLDPDVERWLRLASQRRPEFPQDLLAYAPYVE